MQLYGLSEMCGPGVAAECLTARDGMHVQEDHFLVEVIDPDSGEPLPDGSEGELVFTTLTKEALPMLRYRTGDIGSLIPEPCPCGRSFRRLAHLRGRRDDMIIVRGVNLYPSNVEHVLLGMPEVGPHYQIIVDRLGLMDEVTVLCEPAHDEVERVALQERLKGRAAGADRHPPEGRGARHRLAAALGGQGRAGGGQALAGRFRGPAGRDLGTPPSCQARPTSRSIAG